MDVIHEIRTAVCNCRGLIEIPIIRDTEELLTKVVDYLEGSAERRQIVTRLVAAMLANPEHPDFNYVSIIRSAEQTADQILAGSDRQTAPAVPGTAFGLHHVSRMYQVMRKHDSTIDDVALDSMSDTLRHVLAAPQPDHSPDAGKVVQGEPVGWVVERKGDSTFPRFCFDRFRAENMVREVELLPHATMHPVYAHPAESREEIQALALESAWDKLYDLAEDMRNDDPAEASGIRTAMEYLREEFTRLRASQAEGDSHEQ